MKYISKNRLDNFEFHDSWLSLESWNGDRLVLSASLLNVHKDAAPDNWGCDMEIDLAFIAFDGFRLLEFEPSREWKLDENGNSYTEEPLVIHTGEVADNAFEKEIENGITVYHLVEKNGVYEINAGGMDPYFSIRFSFDSVEIAWDAYRKKAWYELHKHYQRTLTLETPQGDIQATIIITCHDEETRLPLDTTIACNGREANVLAGTEIQSRSVSACLYYNGKEYWGRSDDWLWIASFANIQKKLPKDVKIKCCMTCRYGQLCPVGNTPGEFFCTQDVQINTMDDLYVYTEKPLERSRRLRDATHFCQQYREPTEGYYTYNDYESLTKQSKL